MSELLDDRPTTYTAEPRYEGANIRTWIGFKHFMQLAEQAVLRYFAERGVGARDLYHRYGLGLEIVDSSVQLPSALEVDDEVVTTVTAGTPKPGRGAPVTVQMTVDRGAGPVLSLRGKIRVALVAVKDVAATAPVPPMLEPYVVPEVSMLADADPAPVELSGRDVTELLAPPGSNAYLWSWRIPYFYCHFSDRLQHSGYVRAMEEVVDRFLHDRGISIRTLLDERSWIPVVSRARVRMLSDAFMEETVHTVFTVDDVLKDISYTARMDCYVQRGGRLLHTATGTIMHGYAISRGEDAGSVAVFDDKVRTALLGAGA